MSGIRRVAAVDEVICRLEADGRLLRLFHCTPAAYIDLAAGWLVAEGLIDPDAADVPGLLLEHGRGGAVVRIDGVGGLGDFAPGAFTRTGGFPTRRPPPGDLTIAFRELYARAERYHDTGGIHAAAIVAESGIVAHTEDVGRHNAIDKAVGRALLSGSGLARCGVVTTARISGEMARKAANAGLGWIASRSVPTTLALSIARRTGVAIVARAASAEPRVWSPDDADADTRRPLGVVLAGGRNSRFGGRPKGLEEVGGRRIIDRAIGALRPLCDDVVMIANEPAVYAEVALPTRPDTVAAAGPVGGLREALAWARERECPGALVIACDMPFVPASLLEALWHASGTSDGAVPESEGPRGVEPLCAAYRTSCLDAIERALERGDRRVIGFFDDARIHRLATDVVAAHGDPQRIFFNVNTPEELERARGIEASTRSAEIPRAPAAVASVEGPQQ